MTHYIRTEDNKTLVDLDMIGDDDFSVGVDIVNYTGIFLSMEDESRYIFMVEMGYLQELRSIWWEIEEPRGDKNVSDFISDTLKDISKRWNLYYVID